MDLNSTQLVIFDAHAGLISSIRKSFAGASWQRRQVHFMRNILSSDSKNDSNQFCEAMKTIFRFSDIELARMAKNNLLETHSDKMTYQNTFKNLDKGFEDAFQHTVVNQGQSLIKSTNLIERLNQEVCRCEKVIRIFNFTHNYGLD